MWVIVGLEALLALGLAFLVTRRMFLEANEREGKMLDEAWDEAHLPGKRPK